MTFVRHINLMWKRRIVRKEPTIPEHVPPYYCKPPKEAWRPKNRWFPSATGRDVPVAHRFGLVIIFLPFNWNRIFIH